jgi:uncharacterized protein (DUF302 family)
MARQTIEVERIGVTSSKPFEAVVDALDRAMGHPNAAELKQISEGTGSFAELETAIKRVLGKTELMLFMKFDLGAVLRKESGSDHPRIVRLLVGNPLIMKEMAKHTPNAGSYAPVTILVDERPDGVHLTYDRMASLLAPMEAPTASPSRGRWIRRSRACYAERRLPDGKSDACFARQRGRTRLTGSRHEASHD